MADKNAEPGETIGLLEKKGTNGTMGDVGVSQAHLVDSGSSSGRKFPQYAAALAATLGALATGTTLGWSSPINYKINETNETAYDFEISRSSQAWVSSLLTLGAAAICFPIGIIMDKFGRKTTMLCLTVPFTLGWILITWASNLNMLYAGRFITGVAGGAFCVTAPAYNSEISQDSIRGTLGTFFQLMITVGILFSYVIGSYTSVFVYNILCLCIPLIFAVVFFFMPESPNFLVIKGKLDQARSELVRLRGPDYNVDAELNNLKHKAEQNESRQTSFVSSISKRTAVKAIVICFALMLFQQLSGINAVLFNTTMIFQRAGASISPSVATIVIGVIQVLATFVSSLVVDKLGRRVLLLFSVLVMCLCTTAMGVYFFLLDKHGAEAGIIDSLRWLPLLSLSVFIVAFSFGAGPIPWMMAGELCLIEIKAFVASTAGTFNWLLAFTVTSTFEALNTAIGRGQVFWLFAAIMLAGFLFVFFVVPETKGKSVDEIQVMLGAQPERERADAEKK